MAVRVRASVVVVHDDQLLCVRLRDPVSKVARLFVPGGKLEAGETPLDAAVRETLEETGFEVLPEPTSELIVHYPFEWAGVVVRCQTHFFRARLCAMDKQRAAAPIDDAHYWEGVVWLPLTHLAELAFSAPIHDAVRRLIASRTPRIP
jgi:8-oxo-dGTP pyrophosphatase MutT (NUDIX family)